MDVDHGYADLLEEFGRENLHVSREDYEIGLAGKELEHARLCVNLGSRRDWDVVIRDTEAENIDGVVGMVREDGDNVCIELATAPAPEEVQEASHARRTTLRACVRSRTRNAKPFQTDGRPARRRHVRTFDDYRSVPRAETPSA